MPETGIPTHLMWCGQWRRKSSNWRKKEYASVARMERCNCSRGDSFLTAGEIYRYQQTLLESLEGALDSCQTIHFFLSEPWGMKPSLAGQMRGQSYGVWCGWLGVQCLGLSWDCSPAAASWWKNRDAKFHQRGWWSLGAEKECSPSRPLGWRWQIPLAAGDIFHGASIYGLLRGWDLEKTAEFSNAASAIKCTKLRGRAGIPTLNQAEEFLASRWQWRVA